MSSLPILVAAFAALVQRHRARPSGACVYVSPEQPHGGPKAALGSLAPAPTFRPRRRNWVQLEQVLAAVFRGQKRGEVAPLVR